jgi:signal transduction histidine kinase
MPGDTTFLEGGGETGALIRSIDWAATPLGPVATWSRSLRTVVGLLLRNRFPLLLWWGPQFIQIYNDAYRPIAGTKHPRSFAQPAAECWPEIWHVIGPMIEAPFRGEPATWSDDLAVLVNRKGFLEETHFKVAYSPVPDESTRSGIGGVLATVAETTEEVYARRQLATLRELAGHVSEATTAEQACEMAARTMGANTTDIPCALFYLLDAEGKTARLVGAAGFGASASGDLPPGSITIDDAQGWPMGRVVLERRTAIVGARDFPPGAWGHAPRQAVILPLPAPEKDRAYGALVVAASPHRELDEQYRSFFELAAGHVSSAIRNARAYQQERERAEKLAELDRAKTLFFSNVSHEFRTPLTLMLGPTEDALRSPTPRIDGEALALLHRNELRLLKLVNTLLDFSRIEAGRARASFVETDVGTLTRDLASAFEYAVRTAGLAFRIDCPTIDAAVYVDHDMWEKIVLNLLSNALKFTLEGEIAIRVRRADGEVELSVSDTGSGIPDDELPHLFERFHRVVETRSRTHEGSGIGLALVQEIVRMHGGRIGVKSTLGRGSTFTVRIPSGRAHLPADQVGTPSPLASTALGAAPYVQEALRWLPEAGPTTPLPEAEYVEGTASAEVKHEGRVLIADDNADMRDYLGRLLGMRWQVEVVADGAAALRAARETRPDLVLSDVMMPHLDGFGLLRELRADRRTTGIPVILLSARAGDDARIEGLERGADDYLVKPFSARELIARVAAQIEIARLRMAAHAEREKLLRLFTQSPVPVALLLGPEHRFEFASPSYAEMCGRSDLLGKRLRDVYSELPADHSAYEPLDRAYRTGETVTVEEALVSLRVAGGDRLEDRWFRYVVHPLRGPDRTIEGLMVVAVEITAQVLARKAIEQARSEAEDAKLRLASTAAELEEANRAKDDFLAMLGHELRNPLAPISTAVQLLKLRSNGSSSREVSVIERQSQHIARLVDDLLDVSRIARGKTILNKETIEVSDLVAAAIETASPLIENAQHELVVEVPKDGLVVAVDRGRMTQVLSNLLTNAAKYTPTGGRVSVVAAREGHEVVISVQDTGTGISAELLPRVFDLFVQSRQTIDRSQGGLGLGLALVKSLAVMHGGSVSAYSEGLGRGSTFTVRLPAREAPVSEKESSAPPMVAAESHRQRVLVVDDNRDGAEMLAEALAGLGYRTAVAHDGPGALRIACDFVPDVALLDIGLPIMDGYELAARLREQRRDVKLVAVTGYGQESDQERTRRAGFQAHVTKPADLEKLAKLVAKLAGTGDTTLLPSD